MYHDNTHQGLQSHSVGELYPYSVAVLERNGKSYCQARHLVSGWQGSLRLFVNWQASFDRAHALAEQEARQQIALDKRRQAQRQFWSSLPLAPDWLQASLAIVLVAIVSILSAKLNEEHASKLDVSPIVFDIVRK